MSLRTAVALLACASSTLALAQATNPLPHIETRDNRHALIVDGHPYLLLGAQINNSSSWPSTLPAAWAAAEAMHVNTVEAPVYWEQLEPARGTFDFSTVDLLVTQAREHHLHLVLLWFGTWKNGQNHYVPEWVKSDTSTYPRELDAYGKLLDVMSNVSQSNLNADRAAFAALMRHLKQLDSAEHTVLMIQVENESGSVGSVRDFSPAAQKLFEAPVPADLTHALHLPTGLSWSRTFGADADESFAAFHTARYINAVAAAGKAEYPLPMYCNVWIVYPVHALETRNRASPGQEYPSGGPQQPNVPIWKAAAPAIDILAPDFYSDDATVYRDTLAVYRRADNPIFIPETHVGVNFGRYLFYALGSDAIGFSPFGIDRAQPPGPEAIAAANNYALLDPIGPLLARLSFEGRLQTAVEEKGAVRQTLHFPAATPAATAVEAVASFGFPQSDGAEPPGTPTLQGRTLVAQLGPLEFLVTGFDASVLFRLPNSPGSPSTFPPASPATRAQTRQLELLRAEEGRYVNGAWQATRILNGDQTDRGVQFHGSNPPLVRLLFHTIPLYDDALRRP
ncbi:MAG: DUF5597 domain-containing protein [Acidobacteriota bacterium]|nr:DUF5597 domain-containing protein [Acidobacteriota bacterium]